MSLSFSPDGRTLAIARGARDVAQRDGRIELWDTDSGTLRHTITGFDGPVWSVSFSVDGETLVSGSTELRDTKIQSKARSRSGTVFAELKWWDPKTGELRKKLTMPGEGRLSLVVAYSPDGKSLAALEKYSEVSLGLPDNWLSGSPNSTRNPTVSYDFRESVILKLLDAQTGELKLKVKGGSRSHSWPFGRSMDLTYPGFAGRGTELPVFSSDGAVLAAVSDEEVKLWNARTGAELRTLKNFYGRPRAIAFSPDGRILAVSSSKSRALDRTRYTTESEIMLVDIATAEVVRTLKGRSDSISSLAFTPNGRGVLIGSLQSQPEGWVGTLKVWDLKTQRLISINVHEDQAVLSIAFMPVGHGIAIQSGPSAVELWDPGSWKAKYNFTTDNDSDAKEKAERRFLLSVKQVLAIAFSPDGKTVSGEILEDGIRLWDPRTGEVKQRLSTKRDAPSAIAISSDARALAEVDGKELRLWDLRKQTSRIISAVNPASISTMALSADGETLAIGAEDKITVRRTGADEMAHALGGHNSSISNLLFSGDGRTLVSADEDGTIKAWDVATRQLKTTIATGRKTTALGVSASGQALASAGEDHVVSIWNLQNGTLIQRLTKHDDIINALAFSPDGRLLASGGDDRTVVIWDLAGGKSKRTLKGHDLSVTSLAFSPDGSLVASGSGNASVVLWNVQSGKLDRILR